jgi:hypothetical protein
MPSIKSLYNKMPSIKSIFSILNGKSANVTLESKKMPSIKSIFSISNDVIFESNKMHINHMDSSSRGGSSSQGGGNPWRGGNPSQGGSSSSQGGNPSQGGSSSQGGGSSAQVVGSFTEMCDRRVVGTTSIGTTCIEVGNPRTHARGSGFNILSGVYYVYDQSGVGLRGYIQQYTRQPFDVSYQPYASNLANAMEDHATRSESSVTAINRRQYSREDYRFIYQVLRYRFGPSATDAVGIINTPEHRQYIRSLR